MVELFGICDRRLFHDKFVMACGGSGMEYRRINTLHSSSLCALLFFYNVTKDNPFVCNLEGRMIEFTQSVFEFKSPVITNASNMDVVLTGVDEYGKKVVLFLESKFSEYVTAISNKLDNISYGYADVDICKYSAPFYDDQFLSLIGITKEVIQSNKSKKKELTILLKTQNENKVYMGGVKQMISHFVGICNDLDGKFYDGKKTKEQMDVERQIKDGADIILGEILFDDRIGEFPAEEGKSCFVSYSEIYEKLATKMNDEIKKHKWKNRFSVLPSELKYSQFIPNEYEVQEEILQFYNLWKR